MTLGLYSQRYRGTGRTPKGGQPWLDATCGHNWPRSPEKRFGASCANLMSAWVRGWESLEMPLGPSQERTAEPIPMPAEVQGRGGYLDPAEVCKKASHILARAESERQRLIEEEAAQGLVIA